MSARLVKTRRAPSRHSRDARVYVHTTTAMHKLSTLPSPPNRVRIQQESLDLDPRGRHAAILLAHLSCYASASASATATAATAVENKGFPRQYGVPRGDIAAPPPPLPPRWTPSDERTRELLRVLMLGVSSSRSDVCERGLSRGRGGGGGRGGGRRGGVGEDWGASETLLIRSCGCSFYFLPIFFSVEPESDCRCAYVF